MANESMKVTTIEELKKYREGAVVELPPFGPNQPFYARVRRPSMMGLMRSGKIPNNLLDKAQQLFNGGKDTYESGENPISEVVGVLDVICEAMLLQPTFADLKQAGIELTDQQYIFLFNYSQNGVQALEPFYK